MASKRGPYDKLLDDAGRKRRKKELDRSRSKRKVFVGNQFERWSVLEGESGVKTQEEWARVLLDRHTSETENFQNHILMYAGKRFAYTPPVYKARNLLAALDHNEHIGRPLLRNKEGEICYNRCFNKKSGRWSAHHVKVEKSYAHLRELFLTVLAMRLSDSVGMKRGRTLAPDDPRLLSPNIAPTLPEATRYIVESQKSRLT